MEYWSAGVLVSGEMGEELPEWLMGLREPGECVQLADPVVWGRGIALALAPHPDDPDAIAVTLRLLADSGWEMHWAVVTSGWSGVSDDFVQQGYRSRSRSPDLRRLRRRPPATESPEIRAPGSASVPSWKAEVRMAEQRESARLFGLPLDRLYFLEAEETDEGELAPTPANQRAVTSLLDRLQPDLVLLPHRKDSNPTHRLVHEWFAQWADSVTRPLLALGNEDPKTEDFHPNVEVVFGEEEASWKASLLECHRSQSARNQATRGITFAERILGMNRRAYGVYSERFEAALFGITEKRGGSPR